MFWRQFPATGQLCRVFCARFRFLKELTNFRQNDSCADFSDAKFEQQDSCARYFSTTGELRTVFLSNRRVAHGDFDKFLLVNRTRQVQANPQLRRVCCRQFGATGVLRTVFWTSVSFSTKVANFEQKDSCAECFDANFEQQDSCARRFTQALPS